VEELPKIEMNPRFQLTKTRSNGSRCATRGGKATSSTVPVSKRVPRKRKGGAGGARDSVRAAKRCPRSGGPARKVPHNQPPAFGARSRFGGGPGGSCRFEWILRLKCRQNLPIRSR